MDFSYYYFVFERKSIKSMLVSNLPIEKVENLFALLADILVGQFILLLYYLPNSFLIGKWTSLCGNPPAEVAVLPVSPSALV